MAPATTTKRPVNPRSVLNEAPFIVKGVTAEQLAELAEVLVAHGEAPSTAYGIVGWLSAKAAGQPDRTSHQTRWRYRRILESLPTATLRRVMPSLLRTPGQAA